MCTGVEIALIAGSALSAGSSINAGQNALNAGYRQRALNDVDARAEIAQSMESVKRLRRQKTSVQSSANAALAGAGVDINSKTAQLIQEDVANRAADDIYQTLISGQRRANRIRQQGVAAASQGEDAATAGYLNAGASALGAYSSLAKGWKT
jgi:hypothetical protein